MKKILFALLPALIGRVLRARRARRNGPGPAGGTTRYWPRLMIARNELIGQEISARTGPGSGQGWEVDAGFSWGPPGTTEALKDMVRMAACYRASWPEGTGLSGYFGESTERLVPSERIFWGAPAKCTPGLALASLRRRNRSVPGQEARRRVIWGWAGRPARYDG